MGKRIRFQTVAVMALLYSNKADSRITMISYERVEKFEETINQNLDEINSEFFDYFDLDTDEELYFNACDIDGKKYLVINPKADKKVAYDYHIRPLPIDFLVASNKDNALKCIGLKLVHGKFERI